MEKFDVVIVGAGPAGLKCALELSGSGLEVLLLEKNEIPGIKICAGGITRQCFALLNLPEEIIEHKIDEVILQSRHFKNDKKFPAPVMQTVNRKELGQYQLSLLKDKDIQYLNKAKVTRVNDNSVVVNDDKEYGFRFLVGADGPFSIVRKYLNLPVEKVLATVQYQIPDPATRNRIEIFLNTKYFHSWYAWVFPHKNTLAVGACSNAHYLSGKKLKDNFHRWLKEQQFDLAGAEYQSFPISYDYRGSRFGNIFLAGEAAGLASGLTGEGIFQSVLSGQIIAHAILNNVTDREIMGEVTGYNKFQHKFLNWSYKAGAGRSLLHDAIILMLRNKWVNKKITNSFS